VWGFTIGAAIKKLYAEQQSHTKMRCIRSQISSRRKLCSDLIPTGLIVAINVTVELTGTVEGTESCRRKLFVMVMAADTCLELSATLRAVSVTFGDAGKICGAV
jgi:hypothetical protein